MSNQFEPGVATVALQRDIVSAPPHRVFAKLARARQWHQWLTAANLVSTARAVELQSEDTFTYTASSIVPGFIDSLVLDAEPGQVLSWRDKALFGLIQGEHRWMLQKRGFIRPKTTVIIEHDIFGPLGCLVSAKQLERHTCTWLADLKRACEEPDPQVESRKQKEVAERRRWWTKDNHE